MESDVMDSVRLERYHELSDELVKQASESGNDALSTEVRDFICNHPADENHFPRSNRDLLEAQRMLRHVLEQTKDYSRVYEWYPLFKNPYPLDLSASVPYHVASVRDGALQYRWVADRDCVLECGCGPASLGLQLAPFNRRWIASDVMQPAMLDAMVQQFSPGPSFEFALIDGIDLKGVEDQSVDTVISRSFFEHLLVEDAIRHLGAVYRVLRPGGQLLLACPAGVGPPSDITRQFPEYDIPQGLHIKEYRLGELKNMLNDQGFRKMRSRFIRSHMLAIRLGTWERYNMLPFPLARIVERTARSVWPLAKRQATCRRLWSSFFGHLGATAINVCAYKPR